MKVWENEARLQCVTGTAECGTVWDSGVGPVRRLWGSVQVPCAGVLVSGVMEAGVWEPRGHTVAVGSTCSLEFDIIN